jgi:WD40 repeat protein
VQNRSAATGQKNATNANARPVLEFSGTLKSKDGATLKGHRALVVGLAFSPDDTLLAAGSSDGVVSLWNLPARQGTWLGRHSEGVICVAFSPDGKLLASGGWDKSAKIWDVATKKAVADLKDLPEIVTAIAFSPDSKLIAVGISNGLDERRNMIKIWDISAEKERAVFKGNEGINFLAFSANGRTLAAGSSNLILWNVAEVRKQKSYQMGVTCKLGAFWPDGSFLVFTTPSSWPINQPHTAGVITLLNRETYATLARFEGHTGLISRLALSADKSVLASVSKEVKVWDLKEKKEILSFIRNQKEGTSVSLSTDGSTLAWGRGDGSIKLLDLSDALSSQ